MRIFWTCDILKLLAYPFFKFVLDVIILPTMGAAIGFITSEPIGPTSL